MRLFTPANEASQPVKAAQPVSRYLLPDERPVVIVRKHPAIIIGPVILVLAGLAVAGVLGSVAHANSAALIIIWLACAILVLRLLWRANHFFDYFTVTSSRMLIASGLVNRNVQGISFAEVADMNLRRSAEGRLLGYGELIATATEKNKTLPKMKFVRYPEPIYLEICFLAARGASLTRSVSRIQKVLDPVSKFKIVRLLQRASGTQDADSSAMRREQFYSKVADGFDEDESLERRPELCRDLADYRNYLRRRNTLRCIRLAAIYLIALIVLLMIVVGCWLWTGHSEPNAFWIAFTIATTVTILASCLIWLITHYIDSLDSQLARPVTSGVDQQILEEFNTVWSELSVEFESVTDSSRRPDLMLRSFNAPTLIELESSRVQQSASFQYILEFLQNHITSAVGVAGVRGSGKTTLLRWIKHELDPTWVVLYLSAPMVYDAVDFDRTIFANTAREVISKHSTLVHQGRLASFIEPFRRPSADRRIVMHSDRALVDITGSRSDQRSTSAGISGRGIALQRGRQSTWTEREPSHPELVEAYKAYLEQYRRLEDRPIAIAIDELDKLASAHDAIAAVNGLKDLFHIPNTHFIVSVSEDAMRRFTMRGIPFRDVFDSSFDTIVKIQPLSPDDALKILARRVEGFPASVALFCYAWSGALPRDLIRTARSCVNIVKRAEQPVSVAELAPKIIRRDIADAIDNAVIKNLGSKHAPGMGGLLALRHQIRDETIPLEAVMSAGKLEEAAGFADGMPKDNIMLRRLSVYIEIGSAISQYFSDGITTLLRDDFDRVLDVVGDLASAKAALAVYPPEAEWFLSRARANMGLHLDGDRRPR